MRYSVQPRDQIIVKSYGFLSFAKNVGKNSHKNISKILCGKYGQKLLDYAKQYTTDALKVLLKESLEKQQKLLVIWSAILLLNRITKVPKYS